MADLDGHPVVAADLENKHKPTTDELPLPKHETPHTKDSPLTDIGTSPPPFGLSSLDNRKASGDSYESSELSDLGDDELEAETDKMDFLDDANSATGDKVSDLHALSELTELARLQEVDSDDSDDDFVTSNLPVSPPLPQNGDSHLDSAPGVKRELEGSDNEPDLKKTKLDVAAEDKQPASSKQSTPEVDNASLEDPEEEGAAVGSPTEKDESLAEKAEKPEDEEDPTLSSQEHDLEDHEDPEPAESVEQSKKVKAHHIAQTNLATEAVALASAIEEAEDTKNNTGETSQSEVASSEADVEADVEDVVKQEELDEQNEQEEAEAKDAAEAAKASPTASSAGGDEEEEIDLDLDEHRKLAVEELISIETDFAHLRDKLYHDKLGLLEHELQLCLDGSHPELLQIYYKVNEFYQENIKLANSTLNYSLKCINNETVATRTAIHQDFLRNMMDMKNEMVTKTTSLWYKINRERNYLDLVVPDCNFAALPTISDDRATFGVAGDYALEGSSMNKKVHKQNTLIELVNQRNKFNEQLGILNGLTEFHGIPCGVSTELMESGDFPAEELILRKATSEEINDDLRAMGIF